MTRALAFVFAVTVLLSCKHDPDECDHYFITETKNAQGESAKFFYNGNGKLETISNQYGWTDFFYDESNQLKEVVVNYNGDPNTFKTRYHFNSLGQLLSTTGDGLDSVVLSYNQDGRVSRTDTYDSDGDIRSFKVYTYIDGRKVRIDTYNTVFVEAGTLIRTIAYTFDDKKLPIANEAYYARYIYDDDVILGGNIVAVTEYVQYGNSNGTVTTTTRYEYNSAGYPVSNGSAEFTYSCDAPMKP